MIASRAPVPAPRPIALVAGAVLTPGREQPLGPLLPTSAPAGRAGQLQRMDRLCSLAVCAVDLALGDVPAGERTWQPALTGVIFGSSGGCHKVDELYLKSVIEGQPSPRLFAYTLPSSPVGEVSILHGLTAPGLAVVSGRTSGLEALAEAQAQLARAAVRPSPAPVTACVVVAAEVAEPALLPEALDDAAAALLVVEAGSPLAAAALGHVLTIGCAWSGEGPAAAAVRAVAAARRSVPELNLDGLPVLCDATSASLIGRALDPLVLVEPGAFAGAPDGAPDGALGAVHGLQALWALATAAPGTPLDHERALVLCADAAGHAACALWQRSRPA